MRLKSGQLYWTSTCPTPFEGTRLKRDARCDVLIVGSGVSGAMVAERLSRAGAKVIVVDHRPIASGSTPASTALVLYEIDLPYIELRKKIGPRRAGIAYRAAHAAVDELRRMVGRLDDDCEFQRRPCLYLASKRRDVQALRREARARQRLGIDARFLDERRVRARFGFRRPGAILSSRAYEVNPLRLTHAILRSAVASGATVIPGVRIHSWKFKGSKHPCVVSVGGHTIEADWVVMAAGYEAPEQFEEVRRLTRLKSTYAIATTRLKDDPWPERVMIWEMADPYLYARTTADGRVLLGGLDIETSDPTKRDRLIAGKSRGLARELRRLAPHLSFGVDFKWAGTFAETPDGLPYIGPHPSWPRVLFALGYGGNGLTFSVIAARLVTDAVLGRANRLANLFSLSRAGSGRSY